MRACCPFCLICFWLLSGSTYQGFVPIGAQLLCSHVSKRPKPNWQRPLVQNSKQVHALPQSHCCCSPPGHGRETTSATSNGEKQDERPTSTDVTALHRVVLCQPVFALHFEFQPHLHLHLQLQRHTSNSGGGPEEVCQRSTEVDR